MRARFVLPRKAQAALASLLDPVILILASSSLVIASGGGGVFHVYGTRLVAIRNPWLPILWATTLGIVRVVFARESPLFGPIMSRWRRSPLQLNAVPSGFRPTLINWYAVLLICLCLLVLHHQVLNPQQVTDLGDPLFSIWRLEWIAHQLRVSPRDVFNANIFFPERLTFTYSDSMLLPGVLVAPLLWLGIDARIVYNILLLAGFLSVALAYFFLCQELTGDVQAAVAAGLIGGLHPYHFEHYSHVELQLFFWIPLALVCLQRWLRCGRCRYAVFLGLVVSAQALSSMYYGLMMAVYLLPCAICLAAGWRIQPTRKLIGGALLAVIVSLPAAVLLAVPYIESRAARGDRDIGTTLLYSASPQDYLEANGRSALYGEVFQGAERQERQLFQGFSPLVLGFAGAWIPHSAAQMTYLVAGSLAFDWSLGFNGLGYQFLYNYVFPFRGIRAPVRFVVFVMTTLIILSAFGVRRILRLTNRRQHRLGLLAMLILGILVDVWPRLRLVKVWDSIPTIYQNISSDMVLSEFPMSLGSNITYMYFSTQHWARLVNGYSGFIPNSYVSTENAMKAFPTPASLIYLQRKGVTHLTVNCGMYANRSHCESVLQNLQVSRHVRFIASGRWNGADVRLYALQR